ncbi:MAG: hypothetical protein AAB152_18725 [Candidatus Coatesbacteria bacterium]
MLERFPLDAGWQVAWTSHQGGSPRPEAARGPWLPARVPGDIHLDLIAAGLLPADLYRGDDLDHAGWIEETDVWYALKLYAPPVEPGRRVLLVAHGLDTYACLWLDGEEVGRSANMHLRREWDVTARLASGPSHDLVIRLASPRYEIPFDPALTPLVWSPERVFCRKAQMSFGWDIAPRLMTRGIWRPIELVIADAGRLTDVTVRTIGLRDGGVDAQVVAGVDWAGATGTPGRITGTVHGVPFDARGLLQPGANELVGAVRIERAPLWNPIGLGGPRLVRVEATLEADGIAMDRAEFRTGLRTVALVQEPQDGGTTSFKFRVNGRDLFVTGLNWTPLDSIFPRVTPEKTTRALEAMAAIGCNMLRVWGGGVYETRHFYEECDRLGIMIWQDFMMACGWYPQTDEWALVFDEEGRQVVRDLRRHPCIAIWAGDNENDAFWPELAPKNRLTREVLAAVCRDLDPDRPYVPSSPMSPQSADPNAQTEGDVHSYCHGEDYRIPWFWNMKPRFLSEFGHLSLPSLALIRRTFPAGTEWPLTSAMWSYHGADTIRRKDFRGAGHILKSLKACGKPDPKTIEEAVTASQDLQTEAVVAWIERFSADPGFWGFMLWNVSDCWPQQSDSVTDWDLTPKAIYHALGDLFRRLQRSRHGALP